MKLISVIKNHEREAQYFVYGKSMVKENVCDFQGTITITNVFGLKDSGDGTVKRGKVIGEYHFFENPAQKHVGQFKGIFCSNWYLNKGGVLQYDDLMSDADDYANNQFAGTWSNYSGTATKICNWGDHRIPMANDLDNGTGEFAPAERYFAKGWLNYSQAFGGGNSNEEIGNAQKAEQRAWWK